MIDCDSVAVSIIRLYMKYSRLTRKPALYSFTLRSAVSRLVIDKVVGCTWKGGDVNIVITPKVGVNCGKCERVLHGHGGWKKYSICVRMSHSLHLRQFCSVAEAHDHPTICNVTIVAER